MKALVDPDSRFRASIDLAGHLALLLLLGDGAVNGGQLFSAYSWLGWSVYAVIAVWFVHLFAAVVQKDLQKAQALNLREPRPPKSLFP